MRRWILVLALQGCGGLGETLDAAPETVGARGPSPTEGPAAVRSDVADRSAGAEEAPSDDAAEADAPAPSVDHGASSSGFGAALESVGGGVRRERSAGELEGLAGGLGTVGAGRGGGGTAYGKGVGWIGGSGRGRAVGPTPRPAPGAPALKAACTDDNADFATYLDFLAAWTDVPDRSRHLQWLEVHERVAVEVVDAAGRPVPGVTVGLGDDTRHPVATTLGDGRTYVYPGLHDGDATVLTARLGGAAVSGPVRDGAVRLQLPSEHPVADAVPLDVAFLLDTTGSMDDEIERIKATLLDVVDDLEALERPVDLRLGAVAYRDRGDDYVTRVAPFTGDAQAFHGVLRRVQAGGGGDTPEDLNAALTTALDDLDWRDGAARVAFVIADAPPHMDYADQVPYGDAAARALAEGIRIHTVAASGLDDVGSLVFRQIAQLTRGEFVFITYGSTAASAADHGVDGRQLASNDLDAILFERIRREVDGWGR